MIDEAWHDANRHFLLLEFERLAGHLKDPGPSCATGSADPHAETRESILASMDAPPAIVRLADLFGLSDFERDVILVCAGAELDSSLAALCVPEGSVNRSGPTFGLLLEKLPDAYWSAISPGSPLRALRFIELGDPTSPSTTPIIVDERILNHLVGVDHLDQHLTRHVVGPNRHQMIVPSHEELARRIVALWSVDAVDELSSAVQLVGSDASTSHDVAAAACDAIGLTLCAAPARTLPRGSDDIETFIRRWEREALISDLALIIECDDSTDRESELETAIDRIASRIGGYVLISRPERRRMLGRRKQFTLEVERPTEAEQRSLWRQRIGNGLVTPGRAGDDEAFAELVAHFDLSVQAIDAACTAARIDAAMRDDDTVHDADNDAGPRTPARLDTGVGSAVWESCRSQSRADMEDLARRIDAVASWEDLVVTPMAREALESIVLQVRHRSRVYQDWGFGSSADRSAGVSALFAGPSGTGKTMAAEVLAAELHLDLYSIDLSSLVSKYIGETEKNLRRVFDAAETSGAILLFDEADALFGRRSEVNDSHDRHANIEVSYLLQRMERYRGIAILTSNMKDALDSAFVRRLSFIVDFPFPTNAMRLELWKRAFPPATPVKDLDSERLAQLEVSGGQIRNIARTSAFLAAGADEPVSMHHLRRGAILEYAKTERHIAPVELQGWT